MFKRICSQMFLVCLLLSTPTWAQDSPPQVVGNAFDRDGEQKLYSELHYCDSAGRVCTIEYRNVEGELIAEKSLDYRGAMHQPLVELRDFRSGKVIEFTESSEQDLVVDAGFDNFVRSRWMALLQGDDVRFRFSLPGMDDSIAMRARAALDERCNTVELCLKVTPDAWLLGLVVEPIYLTYSRAERRLLRFRGTSNIRSDKGSSQYVDIRYQYRAVMQMVGPAAGSRSQSYSL